MLLNRANSGKLSYFAGLLRFLFLPLALVLAVASRTTAAEAKSGTTPKLIYTYDARPLNGLDLRFPTNCARIWDTLHTLSALQGLANRTSPRLY
ncbi:MAG: hypothetical protein ACREIC_17540, partial [Limisphaerales bacterium]